jgi:penicillin-binding protein 2
MTKDEIKFKKNLFVTVIISLFSILAIGFYNLQISETMTYTQKSRQNSIKMVTEIPVRGNIYDRNGKLLVGNRPAFSIYLIPNETLDKTVRVMSKIGDIPESEIREKLKKAGRFQPVKIIRQIDLKKLAWIQENILDLPGVEWKSEPRRYYTHTSGMAHLLGTLGEVDDDEVRQNDELESGDIIGKKALERAYDKILRGYKGIRFVRVDALGREVRELPRKSSSFPYPGKQIYLTIDQRLQLYADSLLEGMRGALVAMDCRNGEILSMVSKPDYDLSYFTGQVPAQYWNELIENPFFPLYDRACQSGYPPGSIFKLVAAIAALNENIITENWTSNCPGYFKLGNRVINCWKPDGHGTQNMISAIQNSCNVYFYKLGLLIGLEVWNEYSKLFHFGEKTGIELTNENAGLVPDKNYYQRIYGSKVVTPGVLANLAIGQGELLVTPLQILQFTSAIASRGILVKPHLGLKLYDPVTKAWETIARKSEYISVIDSSVYDVVLQGMRLAASSGTAWAANVWGIPVAGKTGTAQNPHGKAHAWFVGFAPFEEPEIAICVLVENGGSGGGVAAPIGGRYLKRFFYYQGKYSYELEKVRLAEAAKRDSIMIPGSDYNIIMEIDSLNIIPLIPR